MKVGKAHYQSVWVKSSDPSVIQVIDQRFLPHEFVIEDLVTLKDVFIAIKDMHVRGAPLIGAVAAYGMYLAAREAKTPGKMDKHLKESARYLEAARPTAVNLSWAVRKQLEATGKVKSPKEKIEAAFNTANQIADDDVLICRKIGEYGLTLIREIAKRKKGKPVNILTHCNAGWLATVDFGTASAPIFLAHESKIPVHVWVDETRPRNQGASLTAWEYAEHGISHTVIVDNAGGHLMQHGQVDLVIVGTDRTTRTGDVANKIGTYLKALAAKDNQVPFYVALPSHSIDWSMTDGSQIPIEERNPDEVKYISGLVKNRTAKVLIAPKKSPAANFGFDVTPSRLITGLITERGIAHPSEAGLLKLFPEHK